MDKSPASTHVERAESPRKADQRHEPHIVGNLKLLDGNDTILVPTPSPDPKGNVFFFIVRAIHTS